MKEFKVIARFIMAFILAISIICFVLIFTLSNTVLSEKYIFDSLEKADYYNKTYESIESNFEKYIQQYDFTYQKMYQTLTYMHNILEKEFTDDIVGLIPYYYDKAEKHYHTVKQIEENNKNKDINGMYKNKIVYIDPKRKKRKQIDITSIGEEE